MIDGMAHTSGNATLLSTGEAASVLGVSRQHVVDMCDRGELPFIRVGTHRRLRRIDVEHLAAPPLTRDQERSLWLHRVIAGRLAIDPDDILAKARRNVAKLLEVHPSGTVVEWINQWRRLLDAGPDPVLEMLNSRSRRAIELRQNSPFAGVLTDRERQAALLAFRAHWRHEHAA
jgi:excisionase family DNA binding protein